MTVKLKTFEYCLIRFLQILLYLKVLYQNIQSGSMTLCQPQLVKLTCSSLRDHELEKRIC